MLVKGCRPCRRPRKRGKKEDGWALLVWRVRVCPGEKLVLPWLFAVCSDPEVEHKGDDKCHLIATRTGPAHHQIMAPQLSGLAIFAMLADQGHQGSHPKTAFQHLWLFIKQLQYRIKRIQRIGTSTYPSDVCHILRPASRQTTSYMAV